MKLASPLRSLLVAAACGGLVWLGVAVLVDFEPYFVRSPGEVLELLRTPGPERSELVHTSLDTLTTSVLGFAVAVLLATTAALGLTLSGRLSREILTMALWLRSIPLVALVPTIVFAFGRGRTAGVVIAALLAFFPLFLVVTSSLRSAPQNLLDVLAVHDARPLSVLMKVRLPSAVPALIAGARTALPLAMVGSVIGEWLATGRGLGYHLAVSSARADYTTVWAAIVLLAVFSALVQACLGGLERRLAPRFTLGRS